MYENKQTFSNGNYYSPQPTPTAPQPTPTAPQPIIYNARPVVYRKESTRYCCTLDSNCRIFINVRNNFKII